MTESDATNSPSLETPDGSPGPEAHPADQAEASQPEQAAPEAEAQVETADAASQEASEDTHEDAHDEHHEDAHDDLTEDAHDDMPVELQPQPATSSAPAGQSGGGDRGKGGADARSVGFIALPVNTSQLIKKYGVSHPGLVLNKYAVLLRLQDRRLQYNYSAEQKKRILQKAAHLLATTEPLRQQWSQALASRNQLLKLEGARLVNLTSSSALTFAVYHPFAELGVELHSIYGFPYLPAAHIKGALRSHAESHWLPKQPDADAARRQIEQAFGTPGTGDGSGEVIFHDAWPDAWPSLAVELFANHHAPYYQRQAFAGDWQQPQVDYFLVIKPGSRFSFAFSRRSPAVPGSLLQQVEGWLQDLLQNHGLGAYRAQGFGQWKADGRAAHADKNADKNADKSAETVQAESTSADSWETSLALNGPAFLAGPTFRPEDCRLRAGTLRGLMRWWWRTMHSGFMGHREMLALETAIWGAPGRKGAVRIVLEPQQQVQARRYRPEDILRQLPGPEGERRSPGLVYLGYGLFAESAKRYYLGSDARWSLKIEVSPVHWQRKEGAVEIPAEMVMAQAQAALWLLGHYGAVGQRKRKGFGSLQEISGLELTEDRCIELASDLRSHCTLANEFSDERAETPSLMQRIELADIRTPWKNPWFALHQLGESLQTYMQQHKHEAVKQALGLPRPMDAPINGEFKPAAPVSNRHAAPYFLHLTRNEEQEVVIRVVAFPAAKLPDLDQSRKILTELTQQLRTDLGERVVRWATEPVIDMSAPPPVRGRRGDERPPARGRRPEGAAGAEGEARAERPRRPTFVPSPPGSRPERPARPPGERGDRPPRGDRPDRKDRPQGERGMAPRGDRGPRPEGAGFERKTFGDRRGPAAGGDRGKAPVRSSGPRTPQAGDWVEVQLLEERTKKGGWRAENPSNKLAGPVVNTAMVPGDQNPGDKVQMIIHSLNKFEMMFRWPTEAEIAKHDKQRK